MRILYDSLVELELNDGHALHTRQLCEVLAEQGNAIDLVCPRNKYTPISSNLSIVPCRFFGYSKPRLHAYRILLSRVLERQIAAHRPDVIVHKLSQSLPTVVSLARRTGVPLAIELNGALDGVDSWDENMIRRGLRATRNLSRVLLIGVSPELGDRTRPLLGCRDVEYRMFENGVDSALFSSATSTRNRAEFGIPDDAFVIGYLGAANPKYDFDTLFQGAVLARKAGLPVSFLIVAPSAVQERVRALAERFGFADRLHMRALVPHTEVPSFLSLLDCGMVLWLAEDAHMTPTALKLKEFLLWGIPCLANVPSSWKGWALAESVQGITEVNPETVCDRLLTISRDREGERERVAGARELILSKYDWSTVMRGYLSTLEEFCAGGRARPAIDRVAVAAS